MGGLLNMVKTIAYSAQNSFILRLKYKKEGDNHVILNR